MTKQDVINLAKEYGLTPKDLVNNTVSTQDKIQINMLSNTNFHHYLFSSDFNGKIIHPDKVDVVWHSEGDLSITPNNKVVGDRGDKTFNTENIQNNSENEGQRVYYINENNNYGIDKNGNMVLIHRHYTSGMVNADYNIYNTGLKEQVKYGPHTVRCYAYINYRPTFHFAEVA